MASTFSSAVGCFLGCFNSSTALGASYIGKPKSLFTSAIYAVCTFEAVFCFYVLLYHFVGHSFFGLIFFGSLAILSSGSFPSPSPNSTFTLICPSGFLWGKQYYRLNVSIKLKHIPTKITEISVFFCSTNIDYATLFPQIKC